MPATAVLFPGQGSLTPEAADRARTAAPELVERAVALVGCDPFDRAHESTEFAQPAIFVASMAGWYERERELPDVVAMAGHSLGELSALAAAGALDVHDALRLVVLRGGLMANAASRGPSGGMIALLGLPEDDALALGARHGLELANDNAPGQLVLSGRLTGVEALAEEARATGIRAMELDVAGAFHSSQMRPARQPFEAALRTTRFRSVPVPVLSGFTGRLFTDPPRELAAALAAPVRWREVMASLHLLAAEQFVDVGPGQVLARLVKRNRPAKEERALVH